MPSWLWPILPMNTMDSQDGLKLIALPLFLNIFFHFQMDWFGKCHALVSEWFSLKISLDLNIPYIVKHRIHVWLIFILSTSFHFPAQATLSMLATGGSGSFTFYQAVCWKCIYYWIIFIQGTQWYLTFFHLTWSHCISTCISAYTNRATHNCFTNFGPPFGPNFFRSGRISSVYIVGCCGLWVGCHTFV